MDIFDLSGKIAVVTGGNRGIGFGIARGLAKAGATVVIANRDKASGQKAAELLGREGFNVVAIPTDVNSVSSIEAMVSKVINDFGRIDILVNNAGILLRKPIIEVTEEDFDQVINTNLRGLFFCCQLVGREMIKNRKGKIINISSIMSQIAWPDRAVYAASKAAVAHLTRALAVEWAKYNITVNSIGPGTIVTDINRKIFEEHPEEFKKIIEAIPRGRQGYPEDCVGLAILFASDASDFITGQNVIADGGATIP